MELVVAEKPSVARDIARVLGVRASGQDCFEGRDHVITWCIGHLVELEEPAAYDAAWKSWRLDALPMIPHPFQLRASRQTAGHLRAVRGLLRDKRFAAVIDACDAGREGELIFRYVYQYAGAKLPVRRLWISSMTDEAIRRGFATLRPGTAMDPLADAARSRSEADWLVGMNATRAVTVRNREGGHTSLYSIGRVQTPTLAMLVERERAIRQFVPRDYWEVRGQFSAGDATFVAQWRTAAGVRLGRAALADELVARDSAVGAGVVESVKSRTVREAPPLLFDLTSLQRTANRRFGFTATRTLELAQALYERHKLLTYPRTDSRHLSHDLAGTLPELFGSLAEVEDYAPFAQVLVDAPPRISKRVFDDAKVHDHHAIIPTGAAVHLGGLDRDERRLYDLVVRRFLGAFHPDAEFAVTEAWLRVDAVATNSSSAADHGRTSAHAAGGAEGPPILDELPAPPDRYLARGRVRTVAGWQAVAGIDEKTAAANLRDVASGAASRGRDAGGSDANRGERRRAEDDGDHDDPQDATAVLPPLVEGQRLPGRFASQQKQTKPPPRFTEATLLGAMESAGRQIDDEALRAAMRDSGLGTPATRAAIIETLLRREFVVRDRNHLLPTATGTSLIAALPVPSLASPELTGQWEARLSRIARGEETRAAFMADIERYVRDLVATVRASTPTPPPADQPPSAFGRGGGGGGSFGRGGRGGRGARSGRGGSRRGRGGRGNGRAGHAGGSTYAGASSGSIGASRGAFGRGSADGARAGHAGGSTHAGASSGSIGASRGATSSGTLTGSGRIDGPGLGRDDSAARRDRGAEQLGSSPRRDPSDRFASSSGSRDPARPGSKPARVTKSRSKKQLATPAGLARDVDLPAELQAGFVAPPDPRDYRRQTETRSRIDIAHDASLVAALRTSAPRPAAPATEPTGDRGLAGPQAEAHASSPAGGHVAHREQVNAASSPAPAHPRSPDPATAPDPARAPSKSSMPASAVAQGHSRGTNEPSMPASAAARAQPHAVAKATTPRSHPAADPGSATNALTCPRCRLGTLLTGSRGWGCSRWREGCRFVIWFELDGKKLTTAQLNDLVHHGKTRAVKGSRLVLDVNSDRTVRREAT